jgi:glyoxylase-like metal-dependent hydrolase (beta-lactamase superfamily II)/rhodanese-related sulfurtransferase
MIIEQIYTGCLAQGAYYIESNGEAAIIDPLREIKPYLDRAERSGASIKAIFETHFHADFVSGHLDLSKATGAPIIFGPNAHPEFPYHAGIDGETFKIGHLTLELLHTPGHTLESTTYLLRNEKNAPYCIFSGDTLFIGDVGRPDLAAKSHLSKEDLAGLLYDSLRNKIMPLPNEVIVYPAHGAGSACGKNMSKETFDTLGHQKEVNYALRDNMTKTEFIAEVTDGLAPPPAYFPMNVMMNKTGYDGINEVIQRGMLPLIPSEFELLVNESNALVLDTRSADEFAQGHIPNSIFIGIDGGFAPWVGTLITDIKQKIVIVAPEGREEEVITRLARVGYDYALGYLKGGIEAWKEDGRSVETLQRLQPEELKKETTQHPESIVLDVRKPGEFQAEHLLNVQHLALDTINENMAELNREQRYLIHCAGGYRSMIFASILKSRGFENIADVIGGFGKIKTSGLFETTNFVCPSSKT